MRFARIALVLLAIPVTIGGVLMFVSPQSISEFLPGVQLLDGDAIADIRGYYGGRELGLAVFLWASVRSPRLIVPALALVALGFFGSGMARVVSVFVDDAGGQMAFIAIDLGSAALGLAGALVGRRALKQAEPGA